MTEIAEKTSVLVVDDSRTVRAAITKTLNPHHHIIEAEDGEAGWEALLNNNEIKTVISDIQMPHLDGYGLICRIRGSKENRIKAVPIIVVTSADDDTSRQRANACGANDFIVKPFTAKELIQRAKFHTEGGHEGEKAPGQKVGGFEADIEDTVIEAPSFETALKIIKGSATGSIDPYITELCLQVLPLLDYYSEKIGPEMKRELDSIRKKLAAF